VPVAGWFEPSVVTVSLSVAETMPERPSEQDQSTVTSALFQPFALAAVRLVNAILGGVVSIFRATESVELPPALCAVQPEVTLAVSDVKLCVPQPESIATAESGSVTDHATMTVLVYQPFVPSVPVTVFVTTGGVVSPFTI